MNDDLWVRPGLVIPAQELSWVAVRAGGPGGQNVNKVATKVELRFDAPRSRVLDPAVKARLGHLAGARRAADGAIVITSQLTRSQAQNLEDAREKLATLVRAALVVPKKRRPTRPTRAAREQRLDQKRRSSVRKQQRRVDRED